MNSRCLYVPTEDGHCMNCGLLPVRDECPAAGGPLRSGVFGEFYLALAEFGNAIMNTRLGAFIRFLTDLVERTVRDDRA